MKKLEKKIWEFDNVVDNTVADYIEKLCIYHTPYRLGVSHRGTSEYTNEDIYKNSIDNMHEYMQLTCTIINNRSFNQHGPLPPDININTNLPLLLPMFNALSKMNLITTLDEIIRCKLNLQPKIEKEHEGKYNRPHIDISGGDQEEILTMIYYVNQSDGCTVFFNENKFHNPEDIKQLTIAKKVKPKKGKLVAFRGDIVHAGSHPVNSNFRIAINYNLRVSDIHPGQQYYKDTLFSL